MKKSGGGVGGRRRQKDQEMASRMKADGIERRSGVCPICYKSIPLGAGATEHIAQHARGR